MKEIKIISNFKGDEISLEVSDLAIQLLDGTLNPWTYDESLKGLPFEDQFQLGKEIYSFILDMADGYADGAVDLERYKDYLYGIQALASIFETGNGFWYTWEMRMINAMKHELAIIRRFVNKEDLKTLEDLELKIVGF